MKTRLQAGNEIEVLTPSELREILNDMLTQLMDVREPAEVFNVEFPVVANAAGNIGLTEIYEVPLSMVASIHRYTVNAPGVTPAAPLSNAAYHLEIWRNDNSPMNLLMFYPVSGTVIAPVITEEGSGGATVVVGGSRIMLTGGGFPANQQLYIRLQIKLEAWAQRKHVANA